MIMTAIRRDHPRPRPLYMLAEHWFKGYPGVGMIANKIGAVPAHRENAQRLLRDEGKLAIVFPEGIKGTRKVLWQRYKLRRFGRGGFVRTAIRARVPIVPIAVIGAEEAMPIFAHMRGLQRATGLVYAPMNHAFPWFGLAAGAMYLPAKFRIRFCEPIDMSEYPLEVMDDAAEVQMISERIRAQIAGELERDACCARIRVVGIGSQRMARRRARGLVAVAVAAAAVTLGACGRDDFENEPRPPRALRRQRRGLGRRP